MLAIAPKVFREVLSSQVRIDDGTGRVMQFKLSEADLWVRRLTEDTQNSLRSAVEKSVAEAIGGDAPYLFPYVSLKNLAHGEASTVLQSLVSPDQARRLSDLTIGDVIDTYDVPTAVKLTAWLQGTKGPGAELEDLREILKLAQPKAGGKNEEDAAAVESAKPEEAGYDTKAVKSTNNSAGQETKGPSPTTSRRVSAKQARAKTLKTPAKAEAQAPLEFSGPPSLATAVSPADAETSASAPNQSLSEGRPSKPEASPSGHPEGLLPASDRDEPASPSRPIREQEQKALETAGAPVASGGAPEAEAKPAVQRRRKPPTETAKNADTLAAEWLAAYPVMEKLDFEAKLKNVGHIISLEDYRAHAVDVGEDGISVPDAAWAYIELSGRELVCRTDVGRELIRIHSHCVRHIEIAGAASINMAVTKDGISPQEAANLKTVALAELEKIEGFTWLDKNNGWFYLKRHKSRVLKSILKIMAACRKLPLDELMAGVYRSKTGLGPPISKDVFRMLCKHTAGLQVYKDDVVGAKRGWCKPDRLLSEVDQKLVRLFQGKRKVISYQALVQHFADRGLTTATALATPEFHPLLKKVAPMLYTLRGLNVEINAW